MSSGDRTAVWVLLVWARGPWRGEGQPQQHSVVVAAVYHFECVTVASV